MAVLVGLLLAVALVALVHLLVGHLRFRRLELAIPGPPSLPLVGNILGGVGLTPDNLLATFFRLWDYRHSELWRISMCGHMAVFVSDPDHLQELFTRKEFVEKDPFAYKFIHSISYGIFSLYGEAWRAERRTLQPAFHQTVLDKYMPLFSAEAQGFVRRVRPGEAQDVADNLQTMSLRTFIYTALTTDDDEEVEQFLPVAKVLLGSICHSFAHRLFQPWLWFDWSFFTLTQYGRNIRRLLGEIDAFCGKIVAARRVELQNARESGTDRVETPVTKHRTLIDILLEPGDRLKLSDEEILGELKTFMCAAMDTSVATLSWALKVLSLRQDVQQRLLEEVEEVFGREPSSEITTADIDRLEYTERVLKETLRLLTSVPFIVRAAQHEAELCGHTLPAGTSLVVNIIGVHRDPRHWPDPLRFDPDRFLPENSKGRHPYAFIPFSVGKKNCIGNRYSMMAMKALLATLVPRYRIDPVDDGFKEPADLPMATGITSWMVGGTGKCIL